MADSKISPSWFSLMLSNSLAFMKSAHLEFIPYFLIGGFSGAFATSIIQPIDTFKVQIQVLSEKIGRSTNPQNKISIQKIFQTIRAEHKLSVLYRGLDSAIFRQIFYASARLGSYDLGISLMKKNNMKIEKMEKIGLSLVSGVFGALVGNPFDVALIRRQASISSGQSPYKNTYHAFKTIVQKEGLNGLWTGIKITIMRVVIINFGQLAARDIIAEQLQQYVSDKDQRNNITALFASFLTAAISLPADNIKVKLQKQYNSNIVYHGIWDCLRKTLRNEGFLRLWVGFPVYFIRGTPHSFILIKTQLYLNQKFNKLANLID